MIFKIFILSSIIIYIIYVINLSNKKKKLSKSNSKIITKDNIIPAYLQNYGNINIYTKYWINTNSKILLIFSNGFAGNMLQIPETLIKNITDEYSLLLWDYPGVGMSKGFQNSDGSSSLTFENAAECINIIAKKMFSLNYNINKIITIGYSWGGIVSQYALKYDIIRAAISISAGCTLCKNLPGLKNIYNVQSCNKQKYGLGKISKLLFYPPDIDKNNKELKIVNNTNRFLNNNTYSKYIKPLCPLNVIDAQKKEFKKLRNTDNNPGACLIAKQTGKMVYYIHGVNDCVIDNRLSKNAC